MIENWQLPRLAGLSQVQNPLSQLHARSANPLNQVLGDPLPGLAAVAAHFRSIEQRRITALHQQADTEHWHGQIFKRLEAE